MNPDTWISLGLSHHTAPIELRERFAITPAKLLFLQDQLPPLLDPDEGLLILSTCNRVEWIADVRSSTKLWRVIRSSYDSTNLPAPGLLWKRTGWDVLRHLARIVAGLDSLLLGESEIVGQVKSAYERSQQWGIARGGLNTLVQQSINLGRRARRESSLDRGRISLMSLAAQICSDTSGWNSGGTALVLGAGDVGQRMMIELHRMGAKKMLWFSQHANALLFPPIISSKISVVATGHIIPHLEKMDCLVTCSAETSIQWSTALDHTLHKRTTPLVVVDLGVPRNTPHEMERHPKVLLFNVDGLAGRAAQHWQKRQEAASIAENFIASAISELSNKVSLYTPETG